MTLHQQGLPVPTLVWESVCGGLAFDGSWRDVCVFGTDLADWQRALDALRSAGFPLAYYRAGQPAELPPDAAWAFPPPDECDRRLAVWFSGVQANCHFFTTDEIEFDIDPRDVKGQRELDALVGFMRCLAHAIGKDAVLTPENRPEAVVFRVSPTGPAEGSVSGGEHGAKP